ncbi:MAG: hypothetical protein CMP81_05805 [Fulvimarina sp.]|nr:hypothetical protein [Fulvimarina sp.]
MACQPSPPQGGRLNLQWRLRRPIEEEPSGAVSRRARPGPPPISPLVGEMSGRTEGGDGGRRRRTTRRR